MLPPATTTTATTITVDSSPAFFVRRPSPDAPHKLPSHLATGARCLLRTRLSSPIRKQQLQNHLYARNAMDSSRCPFPKMQSRRYLIMMKAPRDRRRPREPSDRSSGGNADARPCYHPSEDIEDGPTSVVGGDGHICEERSLTLAEKARTIVEVNDKATVIISESIDDEIDTRVLWPQLPYITDEHGGIFIEVDKEEEMLESLTENDNRVQLFIGVDNVEKISEMELSGPSGFPLGMEDFMDEELDTDDDLEEDIGISDSDDEDDDDDGYDDDDDDDDYDDFSSETFVDWTNLETMTSCHPIYFAKRIAEAVSDIEIDWMNQPSPILAIQGFLRPAFIEDQSDEVQVEKGETDLSGGSYKRVMFYKLEVITMQLAFGHGNVSMVKVQDYQHAQPDGIAHSAARIISRLKSGGEKTTQALISLCLRCKGIQVEVKDLIALYRILPFQEVYLVGVDSLGFDLRVCSGTQIQNLRFSFKTQATSEYSAEQQLHDLLFPRILTKKQVKKQARHKET